MSDSPVPVDGQRPDWPRLVANAINTVRRWFKGKALVFPPTTLPTSPVEGEVVYDAAAHKLKAWDGSAWQAFW